jgi:hypothetical protein
MAACLALLAPALTAAEPGMRQVVGGIVIYFGILPGDMIRGHPPGHPEGGMHGGVPPGESHLMVALFERAGGARITDAVVQATVSGKGTERLRKPLEPMTIAGSRTYGNYFKLLGPGPYRIDIEIRLPGVSEPLRTAFRWARS